ncbi:hypothetical protein Vafri_11477 [Volvox africanus]|nr:hypothetical protein Vafri_11477 [Volvox africanus]
MNNAEDLNCSGLRRSKRERRTKQQLLPDSYGELEETCTDGSEYEEAGQHASDVDTELNVNSNASKKRPKSQDVAAGPNDAATRLNNVRVQGKSRRRRHRARAAGEDGPAKRPVERNPATRQFKGQEQPGRKATRRVNTVEEMLHESQKLSTQAGNPYMGFLLLYKRDSTGKPAQRMWVSPEPSTCDDRCAE